MHQIGQRAKLATPPSETFCVTFEMGAFVVDRPKDLAACVLERLQPINQCLCVNPVRIRIVIAPEHPVIPMQMQHGADLPCGILCKLAQILGTRQRDIRPRRSIKQPVIRVPMRIGYVQDTDNITKFLINTHGWTAFVPITPRCRNARR
nr:hypothetical protein [Yoonia sp.]